MYECYDASKGENNTYASMGPRVGDISEFVSENFYWSFQLGRLLQ